MASSVFALRLFGTLEASIDNQPLAGLHLREGERLLAYLALRHGQLITYRQLALLFWPSEAQQNEEYEGGDYASTRQGVRALRRALGDHAWRLGSAGRSVTRFDLDGADVDFLRFEQMAQAENDAAAWRCAIQLHREPLLDGWREAWAVEARTRCERSHARLKTLLAAQPIPQEAAVANGTARKGSDEATTSSSHGGTRNSPALGDSPAAFAETNGLPIAPLAHRQERQMDVPPEARTPPPAARGLTLEADGGAVPLDSPFYIPRATDMRFAEAIARQDSIALVKGARQVGKTSLLARGLQAARQTGKRVLMTDFDSLSQRALGSADTLYLTLAQEMADQLALDVDPQESWNPNRSANRNLERFLCNVALASSDAPLVWGLDEVDRLFTLPCGSEVFGLFRSWHNRRALDPDGPWSRLTLVIAYATEAHLFIQDINQSPFNVGTRLHLDDFTPAQLADLNQRYGSPVSIQEVTRFHELIGGHPYLARRGFDTLVTRQIRFDTLEAQADYEDGPFSDHLRRMLTSLTRAPELREAAREVAAGHSCPTPESFYRLRAAGVLTGAALSEARFRCRLYASFLSRHLR